jgi:hypothetical protein
MADNNQGRKWLSAGASVALLAMLAAIAPPASAQDKGPRITVDGAKSVDLRTAPELPAVPRPPGLVTNRPTMPMTDYLAAKNAAAAKIGGARPQGGAVPPPAAGISLYTQVASTNEAQTTGGNLIPPDGDVATSASWMVQVNNDVVTMYNWFTNAFVQKKFNTFFQDSTYFKFDPRVIYDPYWDRFAVLVDGCNPCSGSGTQSFFFLAVSQTGDPTGAYWVWFLSPGAAGSNDFADFPQLGMDLNSIIVTYNDFNPNGSFNSGRTFTMAKAYLYNNHGLGYFVFGGSACTVAPPYVLDDSAAAYVLALCPGDSHVSVGALTNTGLSAANLNWESSTSTPASGIPPQAPQPGVNYPLDTGDNRFENRSVQSGDRILNVVTVNSNGLATPFWLDITIGTSFHYLAASGSWAASPTSSGWRASLNANTVGGSPLGETFGTWMSVDATGNVNVQLRAIGATGEDVGSGAGIPVYTSPRALTGQTDSNGIHRTGDYSYIALYPAAALGCTSANEIGILTGETAGPSLGLWGTRIGIVKHC